MIFWIKKFARILGFITFFLILVIHFSGENAFGFEALLSAIFKAFLGASIIWFAGIIIGDIFFKGVLTDIEMSRANLVEGGMIQQIQMKKEKNVPGGDEMPLTEFVDAAGKNKKKKNQNV